jgi:hypothetical protein
MKHPRPKPPTVKNRAEVTLEGFLAQTKGLCQLTLCALLPGRRAVAPSSPLMFGTLMLIKMGLATGEVTADGGLVAEITPEYLADVHQLANPTDPR